MRLSNGLAPGVLRLTLGYGRTARGTRSAMGVGVNAAVLRRKHLAVDHARRYPAAAPAPTAGFPGGRGTVSRSRATLGSSRPHSRRAPRCRRRKPEAVLQHAAAHAAGDPYAWAMIIDTDACIGCNACVVACQSENNVPSIGPDEIRMGRDMHWLRIDFYDHAPRHQIREPVFQPVPCMHCETAPCEPVCPVEASVHDHEGLNVQVYNRCVGTRFCQSNCPYKVRRFNFFGYADGQEYGDLGDPLVKAANNPDVSVRARGVMEKCTYCVQRISGARRLAEREISSDRGRRGRHRLSGRLSRRRRSSSAISPIRSPPCRACGAIRDITRFWRNSTRGRERPISRVSSNADHEAGSKS